MTFAFLPPTLTNKNSFYLEGYIQHLSDFHNFIFEQCPFMNIKLSHFQTILCCSLLTNDIITTPKVSDRFVEGACLETKYHLVRSLQPVNLDCSECQSWLCGQRSREKNDNMFFSFSHLIMAYRAQKREKR